MTGGIILVGRLGVAMACGKAMNYIKLCSLIGKGRHAVRDN